MIVDDKTFFENLLSKFPDQDLSFVKSLKRTYNSGTAVVKNMKLGGRLEVIKYLHSHEPLTQEKFKHEGILLSISEHHNIPKIYDILRLDDLILFRTQYVEGFSLAEILDHCREKKMMIPKNVATHIVSDIAHALEYAHQDVTYEGRHIPLLHRDVKPSNIMISVSKHHGKKLGSRFMNLFLKNKITSHLIDFGIAEFQDRIHDGHRKEGTHIYKAPEQHTTEKELTWRTDFYQLMIVYTEMLTLKKPHSHATERGAVPVPKGIPKKIARIIEKGTSKEHQGFKKEEEAVNDLEKLHRHMVIKDIWDEFKIPVSVAIIFFIMVGFTYGGYAAWDHATQSIDAHIRRWENDPPSDLQEAFQRLEPLQKRAFRKKYYDPLMEGEFRDNEGNLAYPVYVDAQGHWAMVGADHEDAGYFAGLLFKAHMRWPDEFPGLKKKAVAYADAIADLEIDLAKVDKYYYALIPAYEATGDEKYADVLRDANTRIINVIPMRQGHTSIDDIYNLHNILRTGFVNSTQTRIIKEKADSFFKENLDRSGFMYVTALSNFTIPSGVKLPDEKHGRISTPLDGSLAGSVARSTMVSFDLRNHTSVFTRNYLEALALAATTGDTEKRLLAQTYMNLSEESDGLFLFNDGYNLNDSIADTKAMRIRHICNGTDEWLLEKLYALITNRILREDAQGIVAASPYIENSLYPNNDENKKSTVVSEADYHFISLEN
ncbi:MAG: serine/threonine protein kinase [Nanoarchaeota archaeon]